VEREQIDLAISELETRLERLRALYEHYFMGIERIEPSVPRKDVERRVAELRKERFHSTAQRFKFQTIVQRYNTMQQHWSRICREIELGTFRRHRLKAERSAALPRSLTPTHAPGAQARDAEVEQRAPLDSFVDGDFPAVELGTGTAPIVEEAAVAAAPTDPTGTSAAGMLRRLGSSGATAVTKGLLAGVPPDLARTSRSSLPGLARSVGVAPLAPPPVRAPEAARASASSSEASSPRAADPLVGKAPPATPAVRPPAAASPTAASPAAKPAAASPAAKTSASDDLSEARVRALHRAYVDARKQTNASSVSFEKLERSLRETESKLRQAHQGRKVDFDVVIKDGKAILKPKLT